MSVTCQDILSALVMLVIVPAGGSSSNGSNGNNSHIKKAIAFDSKSQR